MPRKPTLTQSTKWLTLSRTAVYTVIALIHFGLCLRSVDAQQWRSTQNTHSQHVVATAQLTPPSFEQASNRSNDSDLISDLDSPSGAVPPVSVEPLRNAFGSTLGHPIPRHPVDDSAENLRRLPSPNGDSPDVNRQQVNARNAYRRPTAPPTHRVIRAPKPIPGPSIWEGIFGSSVATAPKPGFTSSAQYPPTYQTEFSHPQLEPSHRSSAQYLPVPGGAPQTAPDFDDGQTVSTHPVATPTNPYPIQSDMTESYHPPHVAMRRRFRPPTATIPAARETPTWKTPYSYGYFGASGPRHWMLHHGSRDRATTWQLR